MYYIPGLLTGGGGFFGFCKMKGKKTKVKQASKQIFSVSKAASFVFCFAYCNMELVYLLISKYFTKEAINSQTGNTKTWKNSSDISQTTSHKNLGTKFRSVQMKSLLQKCS